MADINLVDRGGDRALADRGNIAIRINNASGAVPAGGTTGQELVKASNTDFDTHWVTPGGGGIGGSIADSQVAYGSGINIAGDDNLKWNNSLQQLLVGNQVNCDNLIAGSYVQVTPSDQPTPSEGIIYQDSTDHALHHFNGTSWEKLGGGGTFLSTGIARVDAGGSDSTGIVGDLTKPFLTVQAAINAIEALIPVPDWPVIDIGNNSFAETLTTSLNTLIFVGRNSSPQLASEAINSPFSDLTLTAPTGNIALVLKDCNAYDSNGSIHVPDAGSSAPVIYIRLINASCKTISYEGTVGGQLNIIGDSHSRFQSGNCANAVGGDVSVFNFPFGGWQSSSLGPYIQCSSTSDCNLYDSVVYEVYSTQTAVLYGNSVIINNFATTTITYVVPFHGSSGPVTVAYGRVTSQSSANSSIATYTGALDGSYEVSMNMNVSAATGISTSMKCDYTDENNVLQSMILPVTGLTGSFLAGGLVVATGAFATPAIHIRCKGGTAITLYTTAGTYTGVTYNAEGVIKQTQ